MALFYWNFLLNCSKPEWLLWILYFEAFFVAIKMESHTFTNSCKKKYFSSKNVLISSSFGQYFEIVNNKNKFKRFFNFNSDKDPFLHRKLYPACFKNIHPNIFEILKIRYCVFLHWFFSFIPLTVSFSFRYNEKAWMKEFQSN